MEDAALDDITKYYAGAFIVFSLILTAIIGYYIFALSADMAQCENNPSRFCPKIYDSNGLINNKNPNSSINQIKKSVF